MRGARGGALGLALVVTLMLAVGVASAGAATPVLEFTGPEALPYSFEAQGGQVTAALSDFDTVVHCEGSQGRGEIVGPRTAFSSYSFTGCETQGGSQGGHECRSATALEGEIQTPQIEAELVFMSQARKEVGMVLDPHGGVYMEFECGGENVRALGSFVSPIGPINQEGTAFTASLIRSGATQFPGFYESLTGELMPAIPVGQREGSSGTTGVELSFAIHTFQPLQIKAVTAAEVEARQRDDEAAARARQDAEEAARAAAARKQGEEEAARRRQEEEAQQAREREHARAQALARQRSKALKACRKSDTKRARARCERRAKKRFAPPKVATA
jgi:hypothetical protein